MPGFWKNPQNEILEEKNDFFFFYYFVINFNGLLIICIISMSFSRLKVKLLVNLHKGIFFVKKRIKVEEFFLKVFFSKMKKEERKKLPKIEF